MMQTLLLLAPLLDWAPLLLLHPLIMQLLHKAQQQTLTTLTLMTSMPSLMQSVLIIQSQLLLTSKPPSPPSLADN